MKKLGTWVLATIALTATACTSEVAPGADDEAVVAEAGLAQIIQNGFEYNGTIANGSIINGVKANGVKANGVKANGVKANGTTLEGVAEDTGATVSGMGFQGAEMKAILGDGVTEMTIVVANISTQDIPGMYTYHLTEGAGGPSICGNDTLGNPIKAIPLNGVWDYATGAYIDDPTQFTIACRGAALAKCVEMGYSRDGTWSDGGTNVANRALHESCVRMVRADYCGNGVSHTKDGTLIDVFDKKGTQLETANSGMTFEAEWSPDGATCIRRTRWVSDGVSDVEAYLRNTSACDGRFVPDDTSCGTTWRTGGIVRNATGQNDHL